MSGTEELDAAGLLCPLPVLKIAKRMSVLSPGDVLRVTVDDPAAAIDVPHYCAEKGHSYEIEDDSAFPRVVYLITRG